MAVTTIIRRIIGFPRKRGPLLHDTKRRRDAIAAALRIAARRPNNRIAPVLL
jgi:hypothetical protein